MLAASIFKGEMVALSMEIGSWVSHSKALGGKVLWGWASCVGPCRVKEKGIKQWEKGAYEAQEEGEVTYNKLERLRKENELKE